MLEPSRILVVLPNPVGDVVMATPALAALRRRFAAAHITMLGRAPALAVLAGTHLADAVLPERRPWWRTAVALRRRRFDLAVLLPNSFRSALTAWAGGARRIVGTDRGGRGWMLSHPLAPPRDERGRLRAVPQIDTYNALAERAGAPAPDRKMTLGVAPADATAAEALLVEAGVEAARPIVMLNPGAAYGPSKRWPPERFAAVADALIERRDAQIVINAAPTERDIAAAVEVWMRHDPAVNFARCDNTLGLLKALLARTRLLITNDTGARHLGVALGADVVTIFGSTDPERTRLDAPRERIVRVDVPCGPCQKKECPLPAGPERHQCMTAISVAQVLAEAEELLDAPPAQGRADEPASPAEDRLAEEARRRGLDTVDGAFGWVGGEDLDKAGLGDRRRTRLRLPDGTGGQRELYLKRYGPGCWRRGRSPAEAEADGIAAARAAGAGTMRLLAAGEDAPTRRSFVLVTAVPGEALERCGEAFLARHADAPAAVDALTARLAALVRGLHGAGFVHRDLYASHVFLHERPDGPALHLIDLARMLHPRVRRFRWRVKDLAALKYSMPAAWVDGWWAAFLAAYLGEVSDRVRRRWERAIGRKAGRIARHAKRRRARRDA